MTSDEFRERLEELEGEFGVDEPVIVVIERTVVSSDPAEEVPEEDVVEYIERNGRELAVIDRERTEVEL